MLVHFKRPRIVGGKLYQKSHTAQEVPDAMGSDWFFVAIEKAGDVERVKSVAAAPASEEKAKVEVKAFAEADKKKAPSQPQKKG